MGAVCVHKAHCVRGKHDLFLYRFRSYELSFFYPERSLGFPAGNLRTSALVKVVERQGGEAARG